jgi:hypothetical protein
VSSNPNTAKKEENSQITISGMKNMTPLQISVS